MLLNISNIQHFSLGDGDGIRTTVFFKGCNLHCPWCHNPETISPLPQEMHYKNIGKIETCGKMLDSREVLRELLEDRNYYDESGGGVTLSGGEVTLQADGAAELAALLKAEGISVFVDTAGCVPYSAFEKLNDYTDTYLYDFKSGSQEQYKETIGGNFTRIRENLSKLLAGGKNVRVRIPLIPGFNTSRQSIEEICLSLKELGVTSVDLLPFHRMGGSKYDALGLEYACSDTKPLSQDETDTIKKQFLQYFTVNIEH